jgi:hypothetical protein
MEQRLIGYRLQTGVQPDYPCILVCDNVGSHSKAGLHQSAACEHLWHNPEKYKDIYFFFILKNRSHTLQSGDFHVNLSLRSHCRGRAKMRAVQHFLRVHLGDVPTTALSTSELTMKPLAIKWLTEWIEDPRLPSWILSSWRCAMNPREAEVVPMEAVPEEPTMNFTMDTSSDEGSSSSSSSLPALSQSSGNRLLTILSNFPLLSHSQAEVTQALVTSGTFSWRMLAKTAVKNLRWRGPWTPCSSWPRTQPLQRLWHWV